MQLHATIIGRFKEAQELVKEIENQVDSLYDTISNGFKSLEGEASHLDENSG